MPSLPVTGKKFNYYSNLVEEYMSVKEAERVAQQYYCELVMELRQTKAHKQETIEKAKTYSAHLVELSEQVSTYWFMLIRFDLEVIFHQLTNDNEKVISTCRRAAEYFASLPFSALGPRVSFTYRMIPAYLQSGQFSKCQEVIEEWPRPIKGWQLQLAGRHAVSDPAGLSVG